MNKAILASAGLGVSLMLGACESAESQVDLGAEGSLEANCIAEYVDHQAPEMRQLANMAVRSALELADIVDLTESNIIAEYIQSDMSTTSVDADKTSIVAVQRGQDYSCDEIAAYANADAYGVYVPHADTMVLIDRGEYSKFSLGFVMLHEAKHAMDAHESGGLDIDSERRARLYEQQILLEYGGDKYRALLDDVKQFMYEEAEKSQGQGVSNQLILDYMRSKQFEGVFGDSKSESDFIVKSTAVMIHAAFELIAADLPENQAAQAQQEYMNSFVPKMGK